MPFKQLLQVLEERENQDLLQQEGRLDDEGGGNRRGKNGRRSGGRAHGHGAKGRRLLSRVTAHRRARKTLSALTELSECIKEVFVSAANEGRPVEEALILLGASHLSPREIYSVSFPSCPPAAADDISPPRLSGSPVTSNQGVEGEVKSPSQGDACARKLVRAIIGGTAGINLGELPPSRVHIYLRLPPPQPCGDDSDASVSPRQPVVLSPHLRPQPGFRLRGSRLRPPPCIFISATNDSSSREGSGGGAGGCRVGMEGGGLGIWHQVVSSRLVGLKGCNGLA
ncbi:unnamed protein product [Discosporangium mesarthrocarpum]